MAERERREVWFPEPVYPRTREDWEDYVALDYIARHRPYISHFARRFRVTGVRLYRWLWRLEERGFIYPIAPRRRLRVTWRGFQFLTVKAPSRRELVRILPAHYEERLEKKNPRVRVILRVVPTRPPIDPWVLYNVVWWYYRFEIPPHRNRRWPVEWVIRPAVTPEKERCILWWYVGKPVESRFGDARPGKPIPIFMFEEEGKIQFYVHKAYIEERPISCQIATSRATFIMREADLVERDVMRTSITVPREYWPRPLRTWGPYATMIEQWTFDLGTLLGL